MIKEKVCHYLPGDMEEEGMGGEEGGDGRVETIMNKVTNGDIGWKGV